jgi:ATP-dependent 26S proteasome regulatory subunit
MQHPVIFINVPHQLYNGCSGWREVTLARRDSVAGLLALIEECQASYHVPSMHFFGGLGSTSVVPASWNDVVMDETATKLLRHDFESFFQRRSWFRANRLPFRRGYLLHGPPGNGKTSVIRAMLSHPGISGFAANLVTLEMDDNVLQAFFKNAAENTPALVVLEDIDRLFFGHNNDEKPNVSLQQLLNCLDGVGTQDGMIVVATANHPEVLDTAILRRPGRFDRVIELGNPTKELRSTYLQKMCPALVGGGLDICAIASEGLSFAQLRESYICSSGS